MNNLIFQSLTKEEFKSLVSECISESLLNQKPAEATKKYYTRKEVAKELHMSLPTLSERTKSGEIPAYRIGKRVLYNVEEVNQLIKQNSTLKYKKG
jgi:excisionase family DNA binding protein